MTDATAADSPRLGERFEQALLLAVRLHAGQVRKGSATPYIAHLLAVASLVLEDGGDEDQAIAALLHDGPEDQGGRLTLDLIEQRFGERVAEIVAGLTDTFLAPKPPWQARKVAYLEHLEDATPAVYRVSAADKLHNARSLLYDLRQEGERTWARFRGGRQGTLWYYRSLVDVYRRRWPGPLVEELARVVDEIHSLAGEEPA